MPSLRSGCEVSQKESAPLTNRFLLPVRESHFEISGPFSRRMEREQNIPSQHATAALADSCKSTNGKDVSER